MTNREPIAAAQNTALAKLKSMYAVRVVITSATARTVHKLARWLANPIVAVSSKDNKVIVVEAMAQSTDRVCGTGYPLRTLRRDQVKR